MYVFEKIRGLSNTKRPKRLCLFVILHVFYCPVAFTDVYCIYIFIKETTGNCQMEIVKVMLIL